MKKTRACFGNQRDYEGPEIAAGRFCPLMASARNLPYRQRLAAYTRAKLEAASLVGFGSAVPELQSSRAWEVLIGTLSDVLNI